MIKKKKNLKKYSLEIEKSNESKKNFFLFFSTPLKSKIKNKQKENEFNKLIKKKKKKKE